MNRSHQLFRGLRIVVLLQPPTLITWVRFPQAAPNFAPLVQSDRTAGFYPVAVEGIGCRFEPCMALHLTSFFLLLFRFSCIKRRNRAAVRFSESEG